VSKKLLMVGVHLWISMYPKKSSLLSIFFFFLHLRLWNKQGASDSNQSPLRNFWPHPCPAFQRSQGLQDQKKQALRQSGPSSESGGRETKEEWSYEETEKIKKREISRRSNSKFMSTKQLFELNERYLRQWMRRIKRSC
jgi:hypothetical protein